MKKLGTPIRGELGSEKLYVGFAAVGTPPRPVCFGCATLACLLLRFLWERRLLEELWPLEDECCFELRDDPDDRLLPELEPLGLGLYLVGGVVKIGEVVVPVVVVVVVVDVVVLVSEQDDETIVPVTGSGIEETGVPAGALTVIVSVCPVSSLTVIVQVSV